MAKITYTNKVALNENPEIADINKVKDTDMNEIKTVVNGLDDNIGTLSNLTTTAKTSAVAAINELNSNKASTNEVLIQNTEPTAADNKIWIDTGEIASPASEITNEYSTSTGIGYSANYLNDKIIEDSGSNTNGYYIKYADGTMICTKTITGTLGGTAWGNIYYSDHSVGSWAQTFTTIYYANASVALNQYWCNLSGSNFDSVRVFRPNSGTADGEIRLFAIGRWKA